MFWAPPGAWVTSPALPSAVHTASLLGYDWLQLTAAVVLSGHPMLATSPKLLGSLDKTGLLLHE